MFKKVLCCVIAAVFVLGVLAACNRGDNGGATQTGGTYAGHPSGLPPVTLRVMVLGGEETPRTADVFAEINRILQDRINTTIEISNVLQEAYNITVIGLNNVDLITSADWLSYFSNARQGAFQPIPREMIQEHMPQWYATASQNLLAATVDGNIYAVPHAYARVNAPMTILRRDWFPPGMTTVRTMEDLYTYLAHIQATQPQLLMPYVMDQGTTGWINGAKMFGATFLKAPGGPNCTAPVVLDKRDYPNFRLVNNWEQPQIVEYLEWFYRFRTSGFWSHDVPNNPVTMNNAFQEGLSGVMWITNTDAFAWLYPRMRMTEPDVEFYVLDWGLENNVPIDTFSPMNGAMSIPRNGANMERSLMLMELMYTDVELTNVWQFGIEGVDWEFNADNELVRLTEVFVAGFGNPLSNQRIWHVAEGGRWPGLAALNAQIDERLQFNPFVGFGFDSTAPALAAFATASYSQQAQFGVPLYAGFNSDIQGTLDEMNRLNTLAGIEVWADALYEQLQEFITDNNLDALGYTISRR